MMSGGHITTVARQIEAVLDRYEAAQNMETEVASPPSSAAPPRAGNRAGSALGASRSAG